MMFNWTNNLLNYYKNNNAGNCPFCGGKIEVEVLNIGRGSINFKCTNCGKWAHFDKTNKENGTKHD